MKLNLPTVLNNQKMASLFLLSFFRANGVKAGQAFNNCLIANNVTTSYNLLLRYSFNDSSLINDVGRPRICCDFSQCLLNTTPDCPVGTFSFSCNKIAQTIFCWSLLCRGIVGDTPITNVSTSGNASQGKCNSPVVTINSINTYLSTMPVSNYQGINEGYANYTHKFNDSSGATHNIECFWDNGGIICSWIGLYLSEGCYLEWPFPWPGPAKLNPYNSSSFSITSLPSGTSNITNPFASNTLASYITDNSTNSNLVHIVVPVGGAIVGIASVSGLTCYYVIKRKTRYEYSSSEPQPQIITDLSVGHGECYEEFEGLELTRLSTRRESKCETLSPQQLLDRIRNKLGNDQVLLDNFLDAQALLQTANKKNSIIDQRKFDRIKADLERKITPNEMELLTSTTMYLQKPNEQYIAQTEEGPSRR